MLLVKHKPKSVCGILADRHADKINTVVSYSAEGTGWSGLHFHTCTYVYRSLEISCGKAH